MSAPGEAHEQRVAVLNACAVLSGHVRPARLSPDAVPDVVRADPRRQRLFVGDAKDTESPGCAATGRRLHSYARAARRWTDAGYTVRLALCHGRPDQQLSWAALLEHAARCAALQVGPAADEDLGTGEILTWLDALPRRTDGRVAAAAWHLDDVVTPR